MLTVNRDSDLAFDGLQSDGEEEIDEIDIFPLTVSLDFDGAYAIVQFKRERSYETFRQVIAEKTGRCIDDDDDDDKRGDNFRLTYRYSTEARSKKFTHLMSDVDYQRMLVQGRKAAYRLKNGEIRGMRAQTDFTIEICLMEPPKSSKGPVSKGHPRQSLSNSKVCAFIQIVM